MSDDRPKPAAWRRALAWLIKRLGSEVDGRLSRWIAGD